MVHKGSPVRAASTPTNRRVRGDLYRSAYKRARRAINEGFYLEAIVLVESMMADRLESILSGIEGRPVHFHTVNQAADALLKHPELGQSDLLEQVKVWGRNRSRWVHQFAKLGDEDQLTWRGRLTDAHEVALAGFDLLGRISAESTRQTRRSQRKRQ